MYKYIHTCIYLHIYIPAHIHTYRYTHTHIQNVHMNARKHAWNDGAVANARGAVADVVKLCTSLSFDAIKPHFAPPMQGFRCTHFLKHQYPSTPHPLFLTYPRTVRSLCSFTMSPCVVVERLEGKQQCSRAAVSEHAGIQARE